MVGKPRNKTHPDPTKVTEDYWVRASSRNDSGTGRYLNSGKWMLFTKVENHDSVWHKIRVATEDGQLGYSAKAATSKSNPLAARSSSLLTCVYTVDYEDLDDVRRVLISLRGLGFPGRLSYKTDTDTRHLIYGPGTALYVSQPDSLDFENRRTV